MAIYFVIFSIGFIFVNGWIIWQKGRSLFWLLLMGWFSPLWLENKRIIKTETEAVNQKPVEER